MAAPNLDLTVLPEPRSSSSAARRAAFSARLRAASSALVAAASDRWAPRELDPLAQSVAVAASAFRADCASLTDWAAAFFSLAATAF